MTAMFINIIPEFRHDQAVQRLMVASTSSNLSAVVDMLMLGISLEDISVPPAAAEYARRFAQHDLSLEALLRAYYQTERQRWEEPLGCHPHRAGAGGAGYRGAHNVHGRADAGPAAARVAYPRQRQ